MLKPSYRVGNPEPGISAGNCRFPFPETYNEYGKIVVSVQLPVHLTNLNRYGYCPRCSELTINQINLRIIQSIALEKKILTFR